MDPLDATQPEETQAYYDRAEQEGRLLADLGEHLASCEVCTKAMLSENYCEQGQKIMEQLKRWE